MKRIRSVHKPKRIIAILAALFFLTISISSFVIIHITSRKNKLNPIQQTSNSLRFLTISTHLGLVPVGSNRRISFGYKNVTDQEITIETVKKSCACVADIIFPQEAILPGKEGTIEMDYRAGEGKKMYALLVVLSSGESQVLTISSEGYYDIKLSTKQIELPPFAQNTGGKRSVVINGDRDIFDVNSIKIATDTPNWLQLKIAKIEDNAAEAPFTINNHKETKLCPMARIGGKLKVSGTFLIKAYVIYYTYTYGTSGINSLFYLR